jgi:hypothetical protein
MKRIVIFLLTVALLVGVSTILAMSSDNYRLDWFTPLIGGGGGPAGSTHYAVNFTVGQTAIGVASSSSYQACLGYWCGGSSYRIYLPVVLRDYG